MKKRNLIDEYHDNYDDIVNQIKQLDSQYLNDSNNPDYQKQREVLEEKKQYVQGLFEEQLHREEVLPNKAEQLSERLKALHFQIDDLQVEIEKEKKNIVNEENFDDILADMQEVNPEIKAYMLRYQEEHLKKKDAFASFELDW